MNKEILNFDKITELIRSALIEDLGDNGDITSKAVTQVKTTSTAEIIAKDTGVVAGISIAKQVFLAVDENLEIEEMVTDGDHVEKFQVLLTLKGESDSILIAERTALNFLGRLSGIATMTNKYVEKVKGTSAKILDTRKTTPGWRMLEKYAVTCGGGENHRFGLYDMVLIKDNHIVAAGGITPAVERCRTYLKENNISAKIETETQSMADVQEAVALDVDRIMLDNMTADEMKACVEYTDNRIPIEASGNVTLENVRAVAETGVDYISIGALTHSVTCFDTSLKFRASKA